MACASIGRRLFEFFLLEKIKTTLNVQLFAFHFILGMNGPRPSTWTFLCDLPSLATDTKVRFLGWYVLAMYIYREYLTSRL